MAHFSKNVPSSTLFSDERQNRNLSNKVRASFSSEKSMVESVVYASLSCGGCGGLVLGGFNGL